MDAITLFRVCSTVVMALIFAGIVWWAYGSRRGARFHGAAHSVLFDDEFPGSRQGERSVK